MTGGAVGQPHSGQEAREQALLLHGLLEDDAVHHLCMRVWWLSCWRAEDLLGRFAC